MRPKYHRVVLEQFYKKLRPNKVLVILGARRVGKTLLIKEFLKEANESVLQLNGEDVNDAALLKERSVANYSRLLNGITLLAIDEAQHIEGIGLILKLIVDSIEGIKVVITGSSMFDLQNQVGEPLVGRKQTLYLYPLAQLEFQQKENFKQTTELLEERLLFGGYPEITHYNDWQEKQDYLNEIVSAYLLRDILMYQEVKSAEKIRNLLRLLAFQLGKEVSVQELGQQLGLAKNTVNRYLDLLSKVFVIYKVEGFSRNLRKEITKSSRWYFYDNGIRNALINNFSRLSERNDVGDLWENYLVMERVKKQAYQKMGVQNYFWRTYDQQEIDWVETEGDLLRGFEFKWNPNKKVKVPGAWGSTYKEASFEVIHPKNYLDFIT